MWGEKAVDAALGSIVVIRIDVGTHGSIKFQDGTYYKSVVLSGGKRAIEDWAMDWNKARGFLRKIMLLHLTRNFTDIQKALWGKWLDDDCLLIIRKWGMASIPATLRCWMNIVQKELGRDVTNFGPDYGGNGWFDSDRTWTGLFYPSENLQQNGDIEMDGTECYGLVPFAFEGTYKKDIKFCTDDEVWMKCFMVLDVKRKCGDWYDGLRTLNAQFVNITEMNESLNFTEVQIEKWWKWILTYCDPFVERWGKGNIPAPTRVRINAVERNLDGRSATQFGLDTFASGHLPLEYMANFDDYA